MTEPTDGTGQEGPPPESNPYGAPPPQSPPPGYGYAPPPPQPYGWAPPPGAMPGQPYGGYAPAPANMWFDQMSGLWLPNGVELASHGRRIGAYFLSFVLLVATLGIGYIIWGLIVWANGQTPALQVLGMRCWRPAENQVAGWGWMALREVIGRIAEGILSILSLLVSFVMFLSMEKRQTLHDLVAGTVVLHDPHGVLG